MDIARVKKIIKSLDDWIKDVYLEGELNPQNLHIDEINTLTKIKRDGWVNDSLYVFKILTSKFTFRCPYITFLHLDLSDTGQKTELNNISLHWIKDNLGEFTPPSFHFTTLQYYNDFYKKEGTILKPDIDVGNLLGNIDDFVFLFRTYFDAKESMYSRELYIFCVKKSLGKYNNWKKEGRQGRRSK